MPNAFSGIEQVSFPNEQVLDHDTMLASVRSWSWIAALSPEERDEELRALAELLPRDGRWTIPIRTDVFSARRDA